MPQVPVTQREVAQQNTPTPYQNANLSGDMFGANIAQAGQNLGKSMSGVADIAVKIKNYTDENKLLEFQNNLEQWQQDNLFDKDKGYYYQTGKNASGKSTDVMKSYQDYVSEQSSKMGLSPANMRKAQYIAAHKATRISHGVNSHDWRETVNWRSGEAQKAMDFSVKGMVDNRDNEQNININLATGLQAIDILGVDLNMDEDAIAAQKTSFTSNAYKSVLKAQISDGSLAASANYEKWKDKLTAKDREEIYPSIHNNEISYQARSDAQVLVGMDTESAYKAIDGIENIAQRNATEREYERLMRNQNSIQNEKDKEQGEAMMQQMYELEASGADLSTIVRNVMSSDMSFDMKKKLIERAKDIQEYGQLGSSWVDKQYLENMAVSNAEEFKNTNLAKYALTKTEYEHFANLQKQIGSMEYTTQTQMNKIIKEVSTSFGWGSGLSENEYKNELFNVLNKIERLQGNALDIQKMDDKQIKKLLETKEGQTSALLEAFNYKDPNQANKNIDEFKEVYMRAKKVGELSDTVAKNYVDFKLQNKREPNAQEMYDMTLRAYNDLGKAHKQKALDGVVNGTALYNSVYNTKPDNGEQKTTTYFKKVAVPELSRSLGIPLTVTSTYREGDEGGHGQGRKADVSMSEHNVENRIKIVEHMLANPLVNSIGTSDKFILNRFGGNPKIRNLTSYDAQPEIRQKGINHVNHIDVSLNTQYGQKNLGSLSYGN